MLCRIAMRLIADVLFAKFVALESVLRKNTKGPRLVSLHFLRIVFTFVVLKDRKGLNEE